VLNRSSSTKSSGSKPAPATFFSGNGRLWVRAKKRVEGLRDIPWKLFGRGINGKNGAFGSEPVRFRTRPDEPPELQKKALTRVLERPHVKGKFLFVGEEKFWVRGVTYGTFRPDESGANYPAPDVVERDFIAIRSAGLNSIRVYTAPPRWLLDLAAIQGLRVMVGLWWDHHTAFLDDKAKARSIIARIRKDVAQCAGHQAVLCYAIGNEIAGSIVRWYGCEPVQHFLAKLCIVVRQADPGALVTYVNYPTTEYLDLSCVDFVSFNVYLESRERLAAYVARLQNLAGDRPLLLTEVGLDSRRNGLDRQAATLKWQIETIFEAGCAGTFVFAWTDEWNVAGNEIEDWDFGLTARDRRPKPALGSVTRAFQEIPFTSNQDWPRISVVVCSFNGAETLNETLTALGWLNYPDYEVIVVDDGSTDETTAIARSHGVRLIQTENNGLSNARNLGLEAATGSIIAYIDDDAYPDRDWLTFLAASFMRTDHAGIGGPNLAPAGDGLIADAVAHAPGGPVHVLLSDDVAEHIPGCNMAYRVDRLRAIGGFDPRFKVAGDDVDICWQLQDRGWTLGYSPAAVVWHHRRQSVRAYWKQQRGYAKAESLLAEKWPQKYNGAGHLNWSGRLYGSGVINFFLSRPRIYHGTWGSAPFQSVYEPASGLFSAIPLMPEWYFLLGLLGLLSAFGLAWPPLFLLLPVFVLAVAATLVQAGIAARNQHLVAEPWLRRLGLRVLISWLHLLQPLARLLGRIRHGVGPWGLVGLVSGPLRLTDTRSIWCEQWQSMEARLAVVEKILLRERASVGRGGDFDRWDLEIRGGLLGSIRVIGMVEEHGAGKQLFRVRAWPRVPRMAIGLFVVLALCAGLAAYHQDWVALLPLAVGAIAIAVVARADCAKAMRSCRDAIDEYTSLAQGVTAASTDVAAESPSFESAERARGDQNHENETLLF
jgi:cellulose synthase/poly-beta-1,6-N-acetylglucosamine synthase-like glycosyltransferase